MPRKKTTTKVKKTVKLDPAEVATTTKYHPESKIGEPTIGVENAFVTRVGLGNLTVVDNGKQTYKP